MAKYSMASQLKIERVARALYDAAPFEEGDPEKLEEQALDGRAEAKKWDEMDETEYPIKQEFRAMATTAIEAMNDYDLGESLRQFQLPAVMAELTLLSKADALRVLNAAIEQIMETRK